MTEKTIHIPVTMWKVLSVMDNPPLISFNDKALLTQ
jgi:hypothetical protein